MHAFMEHELAEKFQSMSQAVPREGRKVELTTTRAHISFFVIPPKGRHRYFRNVRSSMLSLHYVL